MSEIKQQLLKLIREKAYFEGDFTLSSGAKSDYYIDARLLTLSAEGAFYCGEMILELLKDEKVDAIGGMTLGADPMVGAVGSLSFQKNNPIDTFIIRKEAKGHGKQKQVEGPELKPDMNVVLIDDVATSGKAFLESLDVLEPMGIKVKKAICIVDRDGGAREKLADRGCELVAMYHINEIKSA